MKIGDLILALPELTRLDKLFPTRYAYPMSYEITSTYFFDRWLQGLKDRTTRNKALARIDRVKNGNFGDFKPLGDNLFELRFFLVAGCVFTTPSAIIK